MDKKILPQLTCILRSDDIIAIREVIDAIGFICFYDNTDYPLTDLKQCLNEKGHDDIIRWKIIRAFGSFNDKEVIEILKTVKKYDIKEIIQKEADRSLHNSLL